MTDELAVASAEAFAVEPRQPSAAAAPHASTAPHEASQHAAATRGAAQSPAPTAEPVAFDAGNMLWAIFKQRLATFFRRLFG
jgi:hypothetical protein